MRFRQNTHLQLLSSKNVFDIISKNFFCLTFLNRHIEDLYLLCKEIVRKIYMYFDELLVTKCELVVPSFQMQRNAWFLDQERDLLLDDCTFMQLDNNEGNNNWPFLFNSRCTLTGGQYTGTFYSFWCAQLLTESKYSYNGIQGKYIMGCEHKIYWKDESHS